ncbi:MAG: type II toxin-antitoxin system Phd/YefM family antitoxin [Proteobacteria bacterium]|nr:type II toxin-antitoxin system Phd/YefM family antitoxin [Pseudomonadota bacterium]
MEARKKFGEILNRVDLLKEEIIIERAGKKIAKLSPIDSSEKKIKYTGKLDFRKAAGLGKQIWNNQNAEDYVTKERDSWD